MKTILVWAFLVFAMLGLACDSLYLNPRDDDRGEIFVKFYGGSDDQQGNAVLQIPDGGYLLLGASNSTDDPATSGGDLDFFLVRTDPQGNQQWYRKFDIDGGNDVGKYLIPSGDDFLMAGEATNPGGFTDVYLSLVNLEGNSIWSERDAYGTRSTHESVSQIKRIEGDGFILIGTTDWIEPAKGGNFNPVLDQSDVLLIKTDNMGAVEWQIRTGLARADSGVAVVPLEGGGYAFLASTFVERDGGPGDYDLLLAVTDASGAVFNHWLYGQEGRDDLARDLVIVNDKFYLLGTVLEGGMKTGALVQEVNPDFTKGNSIVLTGPGNEARAGSIRHTGDGFVVCGAVQSPRTSSLDVALWALDNALNERPEWGDVHFYGGPGNDMGQDLFITSDGGYAVCGTQAFGNNTMIGLFKTRQDGLLDPVQ